MKRAIIFSTTYFPLVGGAEVAMKEITDRLPDWQFDLYCAKIKSGLPRTEQMGNILVHRVGIGHPIDKYLLPILGPLSALRTPRPLVWSLMASYGGFASLAYTWLRPRTKMVLTLQEGDPLEHYAKRAGALNFLHRAVFKRANAIQAISRFLAAWGTRMGFNGTLVVIPNGVNVEKFSKRISPQERQRIRSSYGFSDGDTVIVTASRLSLKNGVNDLIRSLVKLPVSMKALIAGEGEDRQKLEVLTEQKGLKDRVVFVGSKSHDELPAILQASDIFCRASLSEGLGNSFLEALAAGIPIIGTPVGGIPDFLTDGETGVFCQPRDPDSLAQAVLRIQNEQELKEKLIAQGSSLVTEKYEWTGIAKRMDNLLSSMII